MLDDLWAQIIEVHNEAKTLFILAEELECEEFRDFIQPINEHRHSLEHIVRAEANRLDLDPDGVSDGYQCDSLRKALGHEYRAFFDCADWIAIILREDIDRALRPYDTSCIKDVLPAYYSELRPRITKISEEIAQKRGDKNVSRTNKIVESVREYKAILDELREIREQITGAQDALEDHRSRTRRATIKTWVLGILGTLITAAIVGVVSFRLGKQTEAKPPVDMPPSQQKSSRQ